ncbi:MAG: stage II sporulation protein D [Mycoplasmatota bacterium]|nr:stage II sporulation protein D [Mycoplasmatota bacterium]
MKKIMIFIILLIFIPFFIVLIYNKNYKEIELNYITTRYIRVKRLNTNNIETIPLEEYIVGVLAGEMPINFDIEALKAQAVASRSYALKRIEYNKDKEYDVVDSILNQVYLDNEYLKKAWGNNYVKNINKLRKAVNATIDEYLSYNSLVVDALFFSTSNGYTEDSQAVFNFECDYLKSVESPWDSEVSSAYLTNKTLSLKEFYQKLNLPYNKNLNVEILKRSSTNRILLLKINNQEFKGTDLYSKLSLRSTDFTITLLGDNVKITTKGYGHGVGMSQYGALGMAKKGYTYEEILKHYYKNTFITKLKN